MMIVRPSEAGGALPSSMSTISARLPSITTDPSLGTLGPAMSLSIADLPASAGPTTAAEAPEGMAKLTFLSGPNVTSRNSIEGDLFTADNYSQRTGDFPTGYNT